MRVVVSTIVLVLSLAFVGCSNSQPAPDDQPKPAVPACNCAKTMPNCKCAHCKDVKANKASPAKCDCAEKGPGHGCGGGG